MKATGVNTGIWIPLANAISVPKPIASSGGPLRADLDCDDEVVKLGTTGITVCHKVFTTRPFPFCLPDA
jgi:hypothetical protein